MLTLIVLDLINPQILQFKPLNTVVLYYMTPIFHLNIFTAMKYVVT